MPVEPEDGGLEGPFEQRAVEVGVGQHGWRLDKFLARLAPEFSRSHLQGLISRGLVQVGGQPASSAAAKVRAGQPVEVVLEPTAESLAFRAEPVPLQIVHEDDHLLVVDKPAGLVVHPAAGNWSGTLLNGLLYRDPASANLPRAGIVHRLDKDTSGLMVVGRTLQAVTALVRAIAAREVHREYLAVAHGELAGPCSLEGPIGRDPASRVKMAVLTSGGRSARTDVRPVASAGGLSALRCTLHTGRTHQIRVHLAHAGHPLVADTLYGGRAVPGLSRQALHAHRLGLCHPVHGHTMNFERDPPADLAVLWQSVVGVGASLA